MKATFRKTAGDYLEATLEIAGFEIVAMDAFGGDGYEFGDIVDVCISVGLHCDEEEWESVFSGNPDRREGLEQQSGWCYRAYGIITSIKPEVMVDVGFTQLVAPIDTNDPSVVGASIAFTIDRLDAYSN